MLKLNGVLFYRNAVSGLVCFGVGNAIVINTHTHTQIFTENLYYLALQTQTIPKRMREYIPNPLNTSSVPSTSFHEIQASPLRNVISLSGRLFPRYLLFCIQIVFNKCATNGFAWWHRQSCYNAVLLGTRIQHQTNCKSSFSISRMRGWEILSPVTEVWAE